MLLEKLYMVSKCALGSLGDFVEVDRLCFEEDLTA